MSSGSWRTPFVVLLCGTAVMLIAFGIRMTYGLWLGPASSGLGWGLESLSFAMAAQALIWGFATPVMGAIADRYGTGRVIAACGVAFALGFIVTANATTRIEAFLGIGVLTGIAMGGLTAPIILTAISKVVEDEKKRGLYAGIASAGGSSGQVVLVPVIQSVLDATDWMTALLILAAVTALIVPLAYTMVSKREHLATAIGQSLGEALGEAFRHPGYLLLTAGYFVCGFQTLFIVTHLPPMLETYDVSPEMGAWSIALIGLFNIVGCVVFGAAGGRWRKKNLLAWIYIGRAVAMTAFILFPVTDALLWLAQEEPARLDLYRARRGDDGVHPFPRHRRQHSRLLRGDGHIVAWRGAADRRRRRPDLRHALHGDAVRLCLRVAPARRVHRHLGRRLAVRHVRELPDRLVGFGRARRGRRGVQPADRRQAGGEACGPARLARLHPLSGSPARTLPAQGLTPNQ